MDNFTAEILTWDMSNLTAEQNKRLHDAKAVAIKAWAKCALADLKGGN